jgi:hypothetical protein
MGGYVDRMMMVLRDPAELVELVSPAADTQGRLIKSLLSAAYDFPSAVVRTVTEVTVLSFTCQRPVFAPVSTTGTWVATTPAYARTDVGYEISDLTQPQWLDVAAELSVSTELEVDGGALDSVRVGGIGDFTTLDEFRAKFRYFDLEAFMAAHHLSTVDDLRRAFSYVRAEIQLKTPPAFEPGDPANQRRFPLRLAILLREVVDLSAVLRDARLTVRSANRALIGPSTVHEGQSRGVLVPVVVFPDAALPPTGFSQAQLTEFFAAQDVVALLRTP